MTGAAWSGQDHGSFMGFPVAMLRFDGEVQQIDPGDTPPIVVNGRTLVPLRLVSEILGLTCEWDQETRTVNIISRAAAPAQEDTEESFPEGATVSGITLTVLSVQYGVQGYGLLVGFRVKNEASVPITHIRLTYTLDNPLYEAELNSRGYALLGDKPGQWIYPGESAEQQYGYFPFWDGVHLTSVTCTYNLRENDGTDSAVTMSPWAVP